MSQKLENILNLALETPLDVRMQTADLNTGFDSLNNTWELIVKYHGNLDQLSAFQIQIEYLIAGYAILTVPEPLVDAVTGIEEIEYVEKPKRYYFTSPEELTHPQRTSPRPMALAHMTPQSMAYESISPEHMAPELTATQLPGIDLLSAACVYPVTRREPYLSGQGVLIAILDSGIDFTRNDFRKTDGTTRILALWDQTITTGTPPEGFYQGSEYTESQINEALEAATLREQSAIVPSIDRNGHGTAVAGIAAGSSQGSYEGMAPNSSLLIVKLGLPKESGFPRTTEIMRGVTYALRKALSMQMPLVINLSFGNSYGSHDGSSLLERFLDNASEIGRTVICVGSGNEGNSSGHAAGSVPDGRTEFTDGNEPAGRTGFTTGSAATGRTELAVAENQRSLSVQLWTHYSDSFRISLRSPGGFMTELPININSGKYILQAEDTNLLIYLGQPLPYSVNRELYIEMLPINDYINSGIWQFLLEPIEVVVGRYYFYLPSAAARNAGTGFTSPTPQVTLTIPSTASKVITVGAYDSIYNSYADFSGRGVLSNDRTIGVVTAGLIKPDLAAPGVNLSAPDLYGGYSPVTGTSFATPAVSGSAALLMEWGIVKANDPFLYGEKVKAYLRKGAKPIRGESQYPNNRVGFGALCVQKSLPRFPAYSV